jgi:uncharacterized protein (DUF488 family)
VKVYTIGFTKKSAASFFTALKDSGARRLVDVRLNNVSQLAGFAKRADLEYFLREIVNMDYVAIRDLAPTQEMLDRYRKENVGWAVYEREFLALMRSRQVENTVSRELIADSVLLCSEEMPDRCHRRLVAEYLQVHWGDMEITHLV